MRLHTLKPRPGSKHRRKRLGQGESSGHGKTAGRGGKGQTARSGSSIRVGFEGGQMPLMRRIPKRGFNNARFATQFLPVNVGDLDQFENGARVDETALRSLGLANRDPDAALAEWWAPALYLRTDPYPLIDQAVPAPPSRPTATIPPAGTIGLDEFVGRRDDVRRLLRILRGDQESTTRAT